MTSVATIAKTPKPTKAARVAGKTAAKTGRVAGRTGKTRNRATTAFVARRDARAAVRRGAPLAGGDTTARAAANKARLQRWLDEQRKDGRALPANPRRPNKIDMTQVAAEAGVYREALLRERSALRAMVVAARAELGIAVRLLRPLVAAPRLCDLMEAAIGERRKVNRREGYEPEQSVREIRLLCRAIAKTLPDGIKAEAKPALAAAEAALAAKTMKLARDVAAQLAFVAGCLDKIEDGLPEDFAGALALACRRLGLPLSALARNVEMRPQVVINWAAGRRVPDKRNERVVTRIEQVLGLKPGALVSRIRRRRQGAGRLPEDVFPVELRGPAGARERAALSALLPADVLDRSEDERARLIAAARARREAEGRKRARRGALLKEPYALPNPWPKDLEREWVECKRFKMRLIPKAGAGIDRRWKPASARAWRRRFGALLGFQTSEAAGAFRVAPEALSFALLAEPKRAHAALQFKIDRVRDAEIRHGGDADALDAVTWTDVDLLTTAASFFGENGWIRQSDTMRAKLGHAGRPDEEWAAHCEAIRAEYKGYEQALRRKALERRKEGTWATQKSVLAILELPHPMVAVKILIDGLEAERAACETDSDLEAMLLQDLVYTHIQEQCGFRPATSIAMRYRGDNGGELRRDAAGWYLAIDKRLFKNGHGKALARDFHRRLDDRWGCYAHIERYVAWARPKLLRGLKTDALFVYGPSVLRRELDGERRGPADERGNNREKILANRVRAFTRRHLGWNEQTGTGIRGVVEFGPTGFRHILATAIVKQSLNLQLAADTIADSLEVTEEHYAHFLPSDREEKRVTAQRGAAAAAERAAKVSRFGPARRRPGSAATAGVARGRRTTGSRRRAGRRP